MKLALSDRLEWTTLWFPSSICRHSKWFLNCWCSLGKNPLFIGLMIQCLSSSSWTWSSLTLTQGLLVQKGFVFSLCFPKTPLTPLSPFPNLILVLLQAKQALHFFLWWGPEHFCWGHLNLLQNCWHHFSWVNSVLTLVYYIMFFILKHIWILLFVAHKTLLQSDIRFPYRHVILLTLTTVLLILSNRATEKNGI